jgi:hypothetical protein
MGEDNTTLFDKPAQNGRRQASHIHKLEDYKRHENKRNSHLYFSK